MTDYSKLLSELSDEADLCRNETAEDIAKLLDEASSAIKNLQNEVEKYKTAWNDLRRPLEWMVFHPKLTVSYCGYSIGAIASDLIRRAYPELNVVVIEALKNAPSIRQESRIIPARTGTPEDYIMDTLKAVGPVSARNLLMYLRAYDDTDSRELQRTLHRLIDAGKIHLGKNLELTVF